MRRTRRCLFAACVVLYAVQSSRAGGDDNLQVSGYLYNHRLNVTLSSKDGRSMPIEIVPKVVFEVHAPTTYAKPALARMAISVHDRQDADLFVDEKDGISIKPGTTAVEFTLRGPLNTAAYADVKVSIDNDVVNQRVPFANCKIHGRVTTFSGEPVDAKAYVTLETGFEKMVVGVECDDSGRYEMVVPRRQYHTIQAIDENFGKTHLERYGHNLHVDDDMKIDFRIGAIELYRLTGAVTAENTVLADFSVFSVHHFLDRMVEEQQKSGKGFSPLAFIANLDHYPPIEKGNVEMYVDGVPLDVWTIERRGSSMKKYGSDEYRRPYWLAEGGLPTPIKPGRHELKVVVTIRSEEDGRVIIEKGEASYHDLTSW